MYLQITCPTCQAIKKIQPDEVDQPHACQKCSSSLSVSKTRLPPKVSAVSETEAHGSADQPGTPTANRTANRTANSTATSEVANEHGSLNLISGVILIVVGCGQLLYSLYLIVHALLGGAALFAKMGLTIFLAAFAIIPEDTGSWLASSPDPLGDVFMPVMLLGKVLAISAIVGGSAMCKTEGAGQMATTLVAVCAALLFMFHLKAGLAVIAAAYCLTGLLAGSYIVRNTEVVEKETQQPL